MIPYLLRRLYWLLRSREPKCRVQRCPFPQSIDSWQSVWCDDHTHAIWAGPEGWRAEAARRVGARRWHLLAEVKAERERLHVAVLEGILGQSDSERKFNRPIWDMVHLDPPMSQRADELVALGLAKQ